jgi:hypothetical protein
MAGLTIRELITRIGFDIEAEKLDAFERKIGTVKKGLFGLTIAAGAAAAGLFAITKSAANAGDDLDAQASVLGFAVEQLQIWTRAAGLGDIAAEEFAGSMQFLNRNIGDAVRGQGAAAKVFKELNIQLKDSAGKVRSTGDVMGDLSERFSKIDDPSKRASLSMDLFGRGGVRMGRFMAESAENVKRATDVVQAFGFYTAETAALADKTNDALEDSQTIIRGVKNEIGIGLLPVLKDMAEGFNNWALANREAIKTKIDRFVTLTSKAIRFAMDLTERFTKFVTALVRNLGGLETILKLVAAAALGLGAASVIAAVQALIAIVATLNIAVGTLLLEFIGIPLLIAAGIALLALVFEDLYVWIKGGDSLIGMWLGNWKDFVAKIKAEFATLIEGLGVIVMAIKQLFTGLWDALAGAFGILRAVWMGDLDLFLVSVKRWAKGLADVISSPLILAFGIVETSVALILKMFEGIYNIAIGLGKILLNLVPPSLTKLISGGINLAATGIGAAASGIKSVAASGIEAVSSGFQSTGNYVPSVTPSTPFSLQRPAAAPTVNGGPVTVEQKIVLPPGTPKEHADEMTRIFNEGLDGAVRHSLQMSTRAGGQ